MLQFFRHTRSLLLQSATALFFLFLYSTPSHAINELVVGTFLDDGVETLSRGGLEKLPRQQEALDFTAPLFLDSKGRYRVEAGYESQPTARIYGGGWKGSRADSERVATSLAAPFSLLGGALQGSVAAGYSFDSFKVKADNQTEGTFVHVDERFRARQAGVYLTALGRIYLGVSLIDSDYRDHLEIPLELEVAPTSWFKLGYKHSYSDFAEDIGLNLQGHQGDLPLKLLETLDELYGVLDCRGIHVKYAQELNTPDNRRIEARLQLPGSLYLIGDYRRRDFAPIDQGLSVDGQPGGTLKARFRKSEYRAGLGAQLSSHWSVEANYRHSEIATEGGGIANTQAIAGFWPSLLLGNYNYLASASLATDQYHLGGEYQGEHFSFGLGMQYLDLRPAARIGYWRATLFGLGKEGAVTKQLTVDRIGMIFLATGMGYKWKNFEVRYAVGQFIPVSEHDTAASSTAPGSGVGGGGGNIFSRIGDKITHYPGGGVQRLLLSLVF
jgi:hypothetical protein